MSYQLVTFLTDYGTEDAYVAICRGVLARFAASTPVVDITHQVPPQNVRRGAAVLAQALPWFPPAVHLAVVDPGVGTERRGVAIEAGRSVLVGPDNGLLLAGAEALGGVRRVTALTDEAAFLQPVSRTFHGRDVFAPVAGRIAAGTPPRALGSELDPAALIHLPAPRLTVSSDQVIAEITAVDRFGNLRLAAGPTDLEWAGLAHEPALRVHVRNTSGIARRAGTFADVDIGDLLVYVESTGRLEVAANQARAADLLGAAEGYPVTLGRVR